MKQGKDHDSKTYCSQQKLFVALPRNSKTSFGEPAQAAPSHQTSSNHTRESPSFLQCSLWITNCQMRKEKDRDSKLYFSQHKLFVTLSRNLKTSLRLSVLARLLKQCRPIKHLPRNHGWFFFWFWIHTASAPITYRLWRSKKEARNRLAGRHSRN